MQIVDASSPHRVFLRSSILFTAQRLYAVIGITIFVSSLQRPVVSFEQSAKIRAFVCSLFSLSPLRLLASNFFSNREKEHKMRVGILLVRRWLCEEGEKRGTTFLVIYMFFITGLLQSSVDLMWRTIGGERGRGEVSGIQEQTPRPKTGKKNQWRLFRPCGRTNYSWYLWAVADGESRQTKTCKRNWGKAISVERREKTDAFSGT